MLYFEKGTNYFPTEIEENNVNCVGPTAYYNVTINEGKLYIDYWFYYEENPFYPSIGQRHITQFDSAYHKHDLEHFLIEFDYNDGNPEFNRAWASNHDEFSPFGVTLKHNYKGPKGYEDATKYKNCDRILFIKHSCKEYDGGKQSIIFVAGGSHAMGFSPENLDMPIDSFDGDETEDSTLIDNFNLVYIYDVNIDNIDEGMQSKDDRVPFPTLRDNLLEEPWEYYD